MTLREEFSRAIRRFVFSRVIKLEAEGKYGIVSSSVSAKLGWYNERRKVAFDCPLHRRKNIRCSFTIFFFVLKERCTKQNFAPICTFRAILV